jgi:hypothetical protein
MKWAQYGFQKRSAERRNTASWKISYTWISTGVDNLFIGGREVLDYIKILRLSYGKKINGREIAETQGCDKTTINDFLRKFKESEEFSYPLAPTVTN